MSVRIEAHYPKLPCATHKCSLSGFPCGKAFLHLRTSGFFTRTSRLTRAFPSNGISG